MIQPFPRTYYRLYLYSVATEVLLLSLVCRTQSAFEIVYKATIFLSILHFYFLVLKHFLDVHMLNYFVLSNTAFELTQYYTPLCKNCICYNAAFSFSSSTQITLIGSWNDNKSAHVLFFDFLRNSFAAFLAVI